MTTAVTNADGVDADPNADVDQNQRVGSPAPAEQHGSSLNQATLFTSLAAVFGFVVLALVLVLAKWKLEGATEGKATLNPLQQPQNRQLPPVPPLRRASSGRQYRSEMLVADSSTFDHANSQQMLDLLRAGNDFSSPATAVPAATAGEYIGERPPAYLVPGLRLDAPAERAAALADDDNNVRLSSSYANPADVIAPVHSHRPVAKYTYHDSAPNHGGGCAGAGGGKAGDNGNGKYDCMRGRKSSGGYAKMRDTNCDGMNLLQVDAGVYAPMQNALAESAVPVAPVATEPDASFYDEPVFSTPFGGYGGSHSSNGSNSNSPKGLGDEGHYHFPSALPNGSDGNTKGISGANGNRHGGVQAPYPQSASIATGCGRNAGCMQMMTSLATNVMKLKVQQSEQAQYQLAPPPTYQAGVSAADAHTYASGQLGAPSYTAACSPPGSRPCSPTYESADLLFDRDAAQAGAGEARYHERAAADYAVDSGRQQTNAPAASDYHAMFAGKRMQLQVSAGQVEMQEEQGREYTYIPRKDMKPSNRLYDQPHLSPATRPVGEVGDNYLNFC